MISLNRGALRELNAFYPDFTLSQLDCWKFETPFTRRWGKDDLILFPNTKNTHYRKAEFNYSEFVYNDWKHNSWLQSNQFILNRPTYKLLPGTLQEAEEIFDKNVLPIKKLVKETGDTKKIVYKEQKIFFLHDDSNIIDHTLYAELNKRVQSYAVISVEFNKNRKELMTTNNLLKFNIKHKIKEKKYYFSYKTF